MSLPALVSPEALLVGRCGYRSALAASIPRRQWHIVDRLCAHGVCSKEPLPRFYWGAADTDWSGDRKP